MKLRTSVIAILLSLSVVSCMATTPTAPVVESSATFPESPLRPPVIGSNAGVSAGHPLTTAAAMEILQQGGNAFDAGVAALLVGGVVEARGRGGFTRASAVMLQELRTAGERGQQVPVRPPLTPIR